MSRRRRKKGKQVKRPRNPVELLITFKGIDSDKSRAIRRALGPYDTGSGYLFGAGLRDHTADVDPEKLDVVIRKLKKIPAVTIKKLVKKWVVVR